MAETITLEQLLEMTSEENRDRVAGMAQIVHARGDQLVVYTNVDLTHPERGDTKILSAGSAGSFLCKGNGLAEDGTPPQKLPDWPGSINWRFQLTHVCPPPPNDAAPE